MTASHKPRGDAARGSDRRSFLDALDEVSEAVESGAGLPAVTRAAGRALDASVIVLDTSSSVLAVACASPDDERAVMAGESGSESIELRVADAPVGQLRYRPRGEPPESSLLRLVTNLIGLEVDRTRAPERATEAAVSDFLSDLLERKVTDRENIVARAALVELGEPRPTGQDRELVIAVPGPDGGLRAAEAVLRELQAGLDNYSFTVALSRPAGDPVDLHRAGAEALLAANVAEARGLIRLSFEETGAYRLLLPAMSEDPTELQGFYDETVAPLVAYDEQYETELVRTLETFLDADGNVAGTAERLFTHRHTIRYRLERVKELSGLDVGSTDGREKLSLGLKAMRVLGIAHRGGPATEAGAAAGRVPRRSLDNQGRGAP